MSWGDFDISAVRESLKVIEKQNDVQIKLTEKNNRLIEQQNELLKKQIELLEAQKNNGQSY